MLRISDSAERVALRILGTGGLLILLPFSMRLCKAVLETLSEHQERFKLVHTHTLSLFENLAKVLVFALCLYLLIKLWGADVTAWVASAVSGAASSIKQAAREFLLATSASLDGSAA